MACKFSARLCISRVTRCRVLDEVRELAVRAAGTDVSHPSFYASTGVKIP